MFRGRRSPPQHPCGMKVEESTPHKHKEALGCATEPHCALSLARRACLLHKGHRRQVHVLLLPILKHRRVVDAPRCNVPMVHQLQRRGCEKEDQGPWLSPAVSRQWSGATSTAGCFWQACRAPESPSPGMHRAGPVRMHMTPHFASTWAPPENTQSRHPCAHPSPHLCGTPKEREDLVIVQAPNPMRPGGLQPVCGLQTAHEGQVRREDCED